MEKKKYERLTLVERTIIESLLRAGQKKSFIADRLGRSGSTISREVNKWGKGPKSYDAKLAQWYADDDYAHKHNKDKLSAYPKLKRYVYKMLKERWSPEQIAGRIKRDYPTDLTMRISHEAIYLYIYRQPQGKENKRLIALLTYHKSRRRSSKQNSRAKGKIKDAVSIDLRPAHVAERSQSGHWEGDLMIGANQASAIGTLVERKTRYTYIIKMKDRKSETVTTGFRDHLDLLDPSLKRTLTYDNGFEMTNHKWLTEQTGLAIFFAHPYSSWERGTNENTNGLIRRFLPKKTDFNLVSWRRLNYIQDKLNNRPRKVLNYQTPNEALELEKQKINNNNNQSVKVRKQLASSCSGH
jgi:IS30 family transposase